MSDATGREDRLGEAIAAWVDRQARSEPVTIDEFCREHPEIAAELSEDLQALAELDAACEPAELPESLSGYRILAEIGSGGMGRVLAAEDQRLGRRVAIKTLAPRYAGNPELRERFLHEARAMARVVHPNIARIYSLGPEGEPPHFVMEFVEGVPLTNAARPLGFNQKAELMRKVAMAVEALHRHGMLHRDLKPGNILVTADLEPKLLDFGLALETGGGQRLTRPGEILGTPDYFSPEQAGGAPADARSDVFALGVILYELLTGSVPFQAAEVGEQIRRIREQDPQPPRRLNPDVPADLQNVCMKALEREPADRYGSAAELAADLERFLAGEPVLATPVSYGRLMAGKAAQHLAELEGWRRDRLLSDSEYDGFRKCYDRLVEREDAWIMEVRRLSLPQVTLYLGAWVLVVGAALIVLFHYARLAGAPAVLVTAAAALPAGWIGLRTWKLGARRVAIAFLLAFCLLLPLALLAAMGEYGLLASATRGKESLELFSKLPAFKRTTNAQLWWAIFISMPAYLGLRRYTRSSVFSLVVSVGAVLLWLATLLRMGLIDWFDTDPGKPYFWLIPCAAAFLAAGMTLERLKLPGDSRYFYPLAVALTYVSLTGVVTFHEPYAKWLRAAAPWTRGELEYLFILNAALYFCLQAACDRFGSAQMRMVAKAFRFVLPGHILLSVLLLGMAAKDLWDKTPANAAMRFEARLFEVILPVLACGFVFGSIRKQMKNFFATGLFFLAAGLIRLQQDLFENHAAWPVALVAAGILLMFTATRYAALVRVLRQMKFGDRKP